MAGFVVKKLFQGFVSLHILHHASEGPVYGSWLMEELAEHGYKLSPGTLYPILHHLEAVGLLEQYEATVSGKFRKYYETTDLGRVELAEAKRYLAELTNEIDGGRDQSTGERAHG